MTVGHRIPDRHAPWWKPALAGTLIAFSLTAVLWTWNYRTHPGLTLGNWFQADLPTYLCYARMAARSTTTIAYAWPHDVREAPPEVFVNLPIAVLGWLLRLGLPVSATEHVPRLIFGAAMFLALGALLRRVLHPGRWFWWGFAIVAMGSGFAWLVAIFDALDAPLFAPAWRAAVSRIEGPYYWWCLDTFRTLMYPLEGAYHAVIFAQLWALASRRYGLATLFCALACASNPFAGIQSSGVQIGALLLARFARPRPSLRVLVASAGVIGLFAAYYGWFLPLDPEIRSLQQQHRDSLPESLSMESLLVAHGPALLVLLAFAFDPPFRRFAWQRFHLMPVLVLVLWTGLLTQHGRLPFATGLMPMHFTRGYLHAGLWILTLAWLQFRLAGRGRPWRGAGILALVFVLVLPDNVMFVEDQYRIGPHVPSIMWPRDYEQVHEYLRGLSRPRRVLASSFTLGPQICGLHEHRSAIGTHRTTPHWDERQEQVARFKADPENEPPIFRWADVVVANTSDAEWVRIMRSSPRWREQICNATWCVFRRIGPRAVPP